MKYQTLQAFYSDKPFRRLSPESDYGSWWTDGDWHPRYRVSYIRDTGEVYAVALAGANPVEVLGIVKPNQGEIYYLILDRLLKGWGDHCGIGITSLQWMRDRLAEMSPVVTVQGGKP